ncbi:MAG TPA: hypothetical protein VFZ07_03855 [Dongiaceae bacterium]
MFERPPEERDIAGGARGEAGAMAMRILAEMGRLLGADRQRQPRQLQGGPVRGALD